ncbi:MAG: PepSY domain-containing protein [Planctomycetota bacterium]
MKLVRRLHMYFGLALMPFVLLYGVTAILFNHPDFLWTSTTEPIDPGALLASLPEATAEMTDADAVARAAFEMLSMASASEISIDQSRPAKIVGDYVIDASTETERVRYRLTSNLSEGTRRLSPRRATEESPLASRIDAPLADNVAVILDNVKQDAEADSVRLRGAPDVEFGVNIDGEPWLVACDFGTGAVSAWRVGEPRRAFDARSFLLRLHVSRGYPLTMSARSVWAVVVDVTASLMIFWAISGLMMWWQMRPTRRSGAVLMSGGLVAAVVLGFAMLRLLYY